MPDHDTSARIALVLGAGGTVGGAFIDAALAELRSLTGFDRADATSVVGTSAGAFRAASAPVQPAGTTRWDELVGLTNGSEWSPRRGDHLFAATRVVGGRLLARLVRGGGEPPAYRVPPPPHHLGAVVVSVGLGGVGRTIHQLSRVADSAAVVRASAAVPFVGGPVCIDGHFHTDGAVHSPTNADLCPASSNLVVVIAPMVARTGGSWLTRLHRVQLRRELTTFLTAGTPIVVVVPEGTDRRRPDHADDFAAAGRADVRRLTTAN